MARTRGKTPEWRKVPVEGSPQGLSTSAEGGFWPARGLKSALVRLIYRQEPVDLAPGRMVVAIQPILFFVYSFALFALCSIVKREVAWTWGWMLGGSLMAALELAACWTYVAYHRRTARFALLDTESCLLVNSFLLPIGRVRVGAKVKETIGSTGPSPLELSRPRHERIPTYHLVIVERPAPLEAGAGRVWITRGCRLELSYKLYGFRDWLRGPSQLAPTGQEPGLDEIVIDETLVKGYSDKGIERAGCGGALFGLLGLFVLLLFSGRRPIHTLFSKPTRLQHLAKADNQPLPGENTDPRLSERRELPHRVQGWPNQRDGLTFPEKLLFVRMEMDKKRYLPSERFRLYVHPLELAPGDRVAVTMEGSADKQIDVSLQQAQAGPSTFAFEFSPTAAGWAPGQHRFSVSTPWGLAGIDCEVGP